VLGETFKDELLSVLGFIQRYQWWLIALSLVVVAIQSRRKRSSGTLPSPSELEEEIEAVEDELTVERRKSQSPTAPPATPAAGSAPTESDG
jgi:predicted Zn-dependent protease